MTSSWKYQLSHNAPFCNRNAHTCAHFCYKLCIVRYGTDALWYLNNMSITHPCLSSNSGLDKRVVTPHKFMWMEFFMHDVIKWKHFPRYWPFVRGIHQSPVNSPHKGQWRGALLFSLIFVWINAWVNDHEAGDLRRHHAHYDVIVMAWPYPWRFNNFMT